MKKFLLMSCFVVCLFHANAQTTFGIKAGLNLASVKISALGMQISTTNKTGMVVGGFLNHSINETISIQPELLYQQMGAKVDGSTLNMNYISIPLLLKYSITDNFNIEAGPQFGLLMSAKADGDDAKDDFKSTDFQPSAVKIKRSSAIKIIINMQTT